MPQQGLTTLTVKCVNIHNGNQRTGEIIGTIRWNPEQKTLSVSVVWEDLGSRRGTVDIRLGQRGSFLYTITPRTLLA